ncbi:Protein of unknown function DUF2800 [uncultured Caudovirales phage]|uniref:DUF2800 domain-containing protein n=1 Tax=uncultured Caudovirales phage TaxID=2100421 RepID=A0A6J5LM73_9CAUD|nr:Protein of unknown function DUF2800 [uncultured Caudovirales phage]CAB4132849.1 Protein of unknown function DUF2800 [uncultured Caudovirales phage]
MSHDKLSPSARHRWGACAAAPREEAKYPEQPSGPAAIDGTHSHTLLETCLKDGLSAFDYRGHEMKDHEGYFIVDDERAKRVDVAVEYVQRRINDLLVQGAVPTLKTEEKVDPHYLVRRNDMSGTVDIQIIGGGVWEICDYKDGMADAWDSAILQMEQYAVGALAGLQIPINLPYPVSTVRLTVIQPKLAARGIDAIRSKDYTVQQIIEDVLPRLAMEAGRTDDPEAPFTPGESQCKYCRAKGACPALAGQVMKEINVMFSPVDIAQQSADKDPTVMSDDQLRQIQEAAPLMRQLLDGVEEEILRRLKAGQPVVGFKLVNGKGSRAWALKDGEMAEKLIKMGIPKSSVYVTKLVSPAQAEKLVWEKTKGGEKVKVQLTDRQLKTMEQEYVVKMAGKLTVAPESDSRPAIVMNAAPMFSAVEETPALPDWLK